MHIQWYTVYIILICNVYTCITIYNVYTSPPDQLIRQGYDSAPGLAGIRCYSFFLRNWLSGFLTTWQKSFDCLPNQASQNPGVLQPSIRFCRPVSCLTCAGSTFIPSIQLNLSQTYIAGSCALGVTHSISTSIDFMEEMLRYGDNNIYT